MGAHLPGALGLADRRVLVTGAASGIGQAAAECLAQLGATLVLTDRGPLDETEARVKALGVPVTCIQGDITDEALRQRLLATGPYYALASAAGVFAGKPGMSEQEAFDFVMGVNVRATMQLASACVDQMIARQEGFVVLVGSAAGRNGGGLPNDSQAYATYAASKGGIHTVVRWLSRRAAVHGVMVNGVAPGIVATPLSAPMKIDTSVLPMKRLGQPHELGWPIALLCTQAASFTSGAILDVNGGMFVG
ncbi:MAG: SDR family oxidoreductase [Rhodoferax sp.]|nr:SDR family oxidoreductase [Rhodoferax sp.]